MQRYIFGKLLALAIAPVATTDGLDFEMSFTTSGGIATEHCTPVTFQGLNVTVTENGMRNMETVVWRCGSTDAGPNHPRAFKDQRGTDMHGYWVRESDTGTTPQSRRAAVIATIVAVDLWAEYCV